MFSACFSRFCEVSSFLVGGVHLTSNSLNDITKHGLELAFRSPDVHYPFDHQWLLVVPCC